MKLKRTGEEGEVELSGRYRAEEWEREREGEREEGGRDEETSGMQQQNRP